MPRLLSAVSLLVVAVTLAACGGGGGQLAGGGDDSATSTSAAAGAGGIRPVAVDDLGGPSSPAATAKTLARVERGLRADVGDAASLTKLGRAQQLAYRALGAHPEWAEKVLAAVPASVRSAVKANIDAGAALSGLTGSAPTGFPDWEILSPPSAATLRGYYDEAERASGISWAYLAAIHLVETRMGRIRGLSSAGAQGPMQFIPETWARYGEGDINDNRQAILAAGRYLAASNGAANIDRALFSYNNDDRYVAAVKAYAGVLQADERAYNGYHAWQVFYSTVDGTFLLPEGFHA